MVRQNEENLSSTSLLSLHISISASEPRRERCVTPPSHTGELRVSSILAASETFGSKRRTCVLASELQPLPQSFSSRMRLAVDMYDLALGLRYHH